MHRADIDVSTFKAPPRKECSSIPPSTGSAVQCGHEWQHLETQYLYHSRSFENPTYERIDRFYCTKCCEIKEVVKSECSCYQPEWFDSRNYRTVRG